MAKPWYNGDHPRVRAEVARTMTSETPCVLCNQVRCPKTGNLLGSRWDLAHDDRYPGRGVWLGPAHPYCNRRAWAQSPNHRGRTAKSFPSSLIDASKGRLRRITKGAVDD